MGKIIKDGFAFMAYANSGLIRRIDDLPELKHALIALGESKTHIEMSRYAVLLAKHILAFSGVECGPEIEACLSVNERWQKGEIGFQTARDAADVVNRLARDEKDPVRAKVLRAMGQVAATPHVRWHALVASEYAVAAVNLIWPGNQEKVGEERRFQIALMEKV